MDIKSNATEYASTNLLRLMPEPESSVSDTFSKVLKTVSSAIDQTASITGLDPTYQDLISQQIEVQQQMQLVSLYSNIEKSKHESQMVPIRNIRVG